MIYNWRLQFFFINLLVCIDNNNNNNELKTQLENFLEQTFIFSDLLVCMNFIWNFYTWSHYLWYFSF